MTFEAPRELLDDAARDATLDEIRGFGVDRVRVLVYWQDYAPDATSRAAPGLRRGRPGRLPGRAWDRLDRLFDAAPARGISVQPTLTGPVPRWATKRGATTSRAVAGGVPGVRDRRRPPLRRPRRRLVDLERAQPPAVPAPAVRAGSRAKSPRIYRKLYQAGQPGSPRRATGTTHPRRRDRAAWHAAGRRAAGFLRGSLCLSSSHRKRRAASASRPTAGRTTPTRRAGPALRPARTATT